MFLAFGNFAILAVILIVVFFVLMGLIEFLFMVVKIALSADHKHAPKFNFSNPLCKLHDKLTLKYQEEWKTKIEEVCDDNGATVGWYVENALYERGDLEYNKHLSPEVQRDKLFTCEIEASRAAKFLHGDTLVTVRTGEIFISIVLLGLLIDCTLWMLSEFFWATTIIGGFAIVFGTIRKVSGMMYQKSHDTAVKLSNHDNRITKLEDGDGRWSHTEKGEK